MTLKPVSDAKPNTFAFETKALVSPTGFREYDARWWFGHPASDKAPELNLMGVQALGMGLATLIRRLGVGPDIVVGHDFRSYSLGIKLAKPERQVVTLIGDGAFLYNPALGSLGAARDYDLPIMAVIFNNKKYAAMQGMHLKMYPDGIAAETDVYHGTHINAPDFVKVAESVGGYGEQVTEPEKLQDALKRGLEASRSGKAAIIDVIVT